MYKSMNGLVLDTNYGVSNLYLIHWIFQYLIIFPGIYFLILIALLITFLLKVWLFKSKYVWTLYLNVRGVVCFNFFIRAWQIVTLDLFLIILFQMNSFKSSKPNGIFVFDFIVALILMILGLVLSVITLLSTLKQKLHINHWRRANMDIAAGLWRSHIFCGIIHYSLFYILRSFLALFIVLGPKGGNYIKSFGVDVACLVFIFLYAVGNLAGVWF